MRKFPGVPWLLAACLTGATGLAQAQIFAPSSPPSLEAALQSSPEAIAQGDDALAFTAIRDMGLTYGMRGGLAWENARISRHLETRSVQLDRVFNFQPLIMAGGTVPPVLVEVRDTFDRKGAEHVVLADIVYRIERGAELRSGPPNWRDYLIRSDAFNARDTGGWTPRNDAEQTAWKRAVEEGWALGIEQAREIFEANVSRLSRDLKGMILYRQLYARNMVSEPVVSKSALGVTGSDIEMNVNEQILLIEERTKMNRDPSAWRGAR